MSNTPHEDAAVVDRAVARIALGQAGVFSHTQAGSVGATPSLVKRRRSQGRWLRVAPGVAAMPGAPRTEEQRRWIVRLSLGDVAVISHEWAGRTHRLPALPLDVWSVTLPTGDHRRRAGLVVHQQHLDPVDVVDVGGFAMTNVPRTICDLATVAAVPRLRVIVEAAHFELGWSFAAMWEALLRAGTMGRPGASGLVKVLAEFGPGDEVSRSRLERALARLLEAVGLGDAAGQHPLPTTGRRRGLVDRALPAAKLVVEADGRSWHARAAAMATDRQRDFEAARVGWQTVRLMYEHIVGDPEDVAAGLIETYELRRALVA